MSLQTLKNQKEKALGSPERVALILVVGAVLCTLIVLYFSPYRTCVRATIERYPDQGENFAKQYCANGRF